MAKRLTDYLDSIGHEIHDEAYVDDGGTIRPITKDERLAREIWKRALGHEEEQQNVDGTVMHRTFPPDPKAQQFIFERREGKFVTPTDEKSMKLLERISEIAKLQINDEAEQAVDDRDTPQTDAE
jgi:hypothetical protein